MICIVSLGLDGTRTDPVHPPVELVVTVELLIDVVPNLIEVEVLEIKLLNAIVTFSPTGPNIGDTELMTGVVTVNGEVIGTCPSDTKIVERPAVVFAPT